MRTIYKPWGKEEWLELNSHYCYKRIYINAGYKTSYQYHLKKYETNYLISGTAELWLEDEHAGVNKTIIHPGDYFNVPPPRKHRIIALTDIILQEVSTPDVDDVIRLDDDTNRKDGKLEEEQKTPAVLILAAGLGTRVRQLAKNKNKTLIPINNKAILSYIIDPFPKEYEIIIAVGYQKESLKEYCLLAHPDRKFTFVDVVDWDNPTVGPGSSALQCQGYLQRPFYLITADTIVDGPLPYLDGNWLGTSPTGFPEKYSTLAIDEHQNVTAFVNKSPKGYDNAFMGLAGIRDYQFFWSELELANKTNTELVAAWYHPEKYPNLKAKPISWFDTGNLEDIQRAKEHFKDKPLSLYKNIEDTTYKIGQRFLKFSSDIQVTHNRYRRGVILKDFVPANLIQTDHFISYDWEEGKTLYEHNSLTAYTMFLEWFGKLLSECEKTTCENLIMPFYVQKTNTRMNAFLAKYNPSYFTTEFTINGVTYPSMRSLLEKVNFESLKHNPFYTKFHGDLQFDNIIFNPETGKFSYIDWRESFAGFVERGDLYYDLGKLYGGCLLPYNLLKDDTHIEISEGVSVVTYQYDVPRPLSEFQKKYEVGIMDGFDIQKVKLIKSLIYLNMSPLHTDKFNKLLWFKAIEGLHECTNK